MLLVMISIGCSEWISWIRYDYSCGDLMSLLRCLSLLLLLPVPLFSECAHMFAYRWLGVFR
jgi:hypothetical protein